ncbi:MAG: hypothetical protein AB1938_00950 [Myxococcota bacterium]
MSYATGGQYSGYFRTTGCGTPSLPACLFQTNPLGSYAVASSGIRTDAEGYSHGLWVSAKDGAALKAFANGYWEPVVSVEALQSSTYGGIGLNVRGRSGYGYAGYIQNVTGTNGLYVGAAPGTFNTSLYVSGNALVSGTLFASTKNFRIDHPQFPDSKYLQHSVIESDGYKVQYDGNVVLDSKGEGSVTLPGYVELVGRDFRYQLTPIGSAASVYVASELSGGRFTIAGGRAGQKVSWSLTGIRKDPAAVAEPLVVEQAKPPERQGRYLRPELYGQPASLSEAAEATATRTPPAADSGKTFGAAQLNPPVRLGH